jgi:hypothetical protein
LLIRYFERLADSKIIAWSDPRAGFAATASQLDRYIGLTSRGPVRL